MDTSGGIYRIHIKERLDPAWQVWFEAFDISAGESGGGTSMTGYLPDQPALHGLLSRVRDLGLTLITVERLGDSDPPLESAPKL